MSANITSWNSLTPILQGPELCFDVLAIQEHRLVKAKWGCAQKDLPSQYRAAGSAAMLTAQGGASSGVGFVWPTHMPVTQAGHLFNEPRRYSIEIFDIQFVSFYGAQDPPAVYEALSETLVMLKATGKPYIIMGDFNLSSKVVNEWLHTIHCLHAVVIDFGATCGGVTDVDFMIVSKTLMHQCTEILRHKTSLATHDPISLTLSPPDDPEYHYEAWDPPKRATIGTGFRPRFQCEASHLRWQVSTEALRAAASPGERDMQHLHSQWLQWARKEIAANAGHELDPLAGAATVGRLTDPITERRRQEGYNKKFGQMRTLQWALRRVQEP
jgi:hypothetical protein